MQIYASIDLKSFYASAECVLRNLDPLTTNLIVADESRTDKTIILAVSPALKTYNIPGRLRLFEFKQKIHSINQERLKQAQKHHFKAKSFDTLELENDLNLELDYIIAKPRMATYIEFSTKIYSIYLKYFDPKDIHIYSIDEVFIDLSSYLERYKLSAHELLTKILLDILHTSKITATAGIGTNLYLAKIAMDILAKRQKVDENGLLIAFLDEKLYRYKLWHHKPLKDFWRIGKGIALKLANLNIHTMGDLARFSLKHEALLYKHFGINAELLIDHAWGIETCTMKDIKNYKSQNHSKVMAKVLPFAYDNTQAMKVLKELVDHLVLELIQNNLKTNHITLDIQYDKSNLENSSLLASYKGVTTKDSYGRTIPKNAHGSINLENFTHSLKIINKKTLELFCKISDKSLSIRKISLSLNNITDKVQENYQELNLFSDFNAISQEKNQLEKEENLQKARLQIMQKFGKKAILKASSLDNETKEITSLIGGHNA
ncbi:DNA methylase [Campylobacter lari]|uniref:Y-family DNA polymerase n=1 Tax=Campylobacter lari TaxID=201 RepID=UPI00127A131E|nr:DNA methylase [Campylobacter lari]EAI7247871.1 DNA methylase [Campylobacter lari]EAK0798035.1 DNA methylase [Campylobacter lari]EDP6836943.1 DNA methylase [Campylobacter lari]EGK7475585.1 DNA methylase [Campylobacter lari]EGK8087591.1 DNA methylase [Campylobacter lari]